MKIIYFDTNALLGIYAYSFDTINSIINSLYELEKKEQFNVVIPATVYEEFKRNYHASRSRHSGRYPIAVFKKILTFKGILF